MLHQRFIGAVLARDRPAVSFGLFAVIGLAWAYLIYKGFAGMGEVNVDMTMPLVQSWTAVDVGALVLMWLVMMVAMMLPTAAPMILTFATINRKRGERSRPTTRTSVFTMGYVLVWSGFAVAASAVQWGLHSASALSPMMVSTSDLLGGGLLIVAGAFQWSGVKNVCLAQCRSPIGFVLSEWRDGASGALTMGLKHGVYCLGCCWALMSLLFVVGVMNLLWIAALAGFVLLEKLTPAGRPLSRLTGLMLLAWGVLLLAGAVG